MEKLVSTTPKARSTFQSCSSEAAMEMEMSSRNCCSVEGLFRETI